ncbi:PREDICTED: probable acyl-activating enzyme 10 [Tarenaya hassleriana]|uniref:probable acyl-activating enzyme 10 n=1 Tax=Tarenaya hassleriana TaxID=28532 RepID=UPI00053C2866|nr:PREDICTED: probable acyl-activating enzyme 10 [Tarenaya hassleriana]
MDLLLPHPSNSAPLTVLGFLERAATAYGDSPSIVHTATPTTWSETYRRCLRMRSSVSSTAAIQKGQVVSVVGPNVPSVYELQFAVPMSGAILNNINPRLDANALSVLLDHSGSKLVFVDHKSKPLVLEAVEILRKKGGRAPLLVLLHDDDDGNAKLDDENFIGTYEGLMESGDPSFKWVRPRNEQEPMVLNYTSGTTSSPKGVLLSHRAAYINTISSLIDWSVPNRPVYLWTLPIFHANGWTYTWGMAAVGGKNVCMRRPDVSQEVFDLMEKHDVTHMCAAPELLNRLVIHRKERPLKKPVRVMTGGSSPKKISEYESLGFDVSHGYGMTEVGGMMTSCAWKPEWNVLDAMERARLKSRQGVRTLGISEVDVIDPETGESLKHDGVSQGEIVVRGMGMMLGYYKNPEGTAECMKSDGWFYTGDLGVIHEDNYIEIKGRSKDVIICGGENINSIEVETVLCMHPNVKEAAVVARPDSFWGEVAYAFVCLKDGRGGKVNEKEIRDHCKEKLPSYMVPRDVEFVEDLPKTATGKIQKFILREKWLK